VVQDAHVDQRERLLQLAGKQLIGLRGLGHAGRMVVGEDDCGGIGRERRFDHFPRVHARLGQGAAEQLLRANHAVLRIEEQAHEGLVRPRAEQQTQVIAHRAGGGQGRAGTQLLAQRASRELEDRPEQCGLGRPETPHALQCAQIRAQQPPEPAVLREQCTPEVDCADPPHAAAQAKRQQLGVRQGVGPAGQQPLAGSFSR